MKSFTRESGLERKDIKMVKKIILIVFMICSIGSYVLALSPSHPLAVIQANKYSGITMMRGLSGQWTSPVRIYSDSEFTIYIDAESVDIDFDRFRPVGQANLLNYLSNAEFGVSVVVEYKSKKVLKEVIKNLKEAMTNVPGGEQLYPDLFRYRSEWRHYDLKNNKMTVYYQQYLDRDGEILAQAPVQKNVPKEELMGVMPPNFTVDLKSNPNYLKVANNVIKLFQMAMRDPKVDDRVKRLLTGTFSKSSSRQGYTTYRNYQFGYQIDYPEEFIRRAAGEADKIMFAYPKENVILVLVGGDNRGTTLMQCFDDNKKSSVQDAEITWQTIKENWFAMTWKIDFEGKPYLNYLKMFVGPQNGSANGFMFTYPENEEDKYGKVLVNLQNSFIPGNIDRPGRR
jgi:hypothetical protein